MKTISDITREVRAEVKKMICSITDHGVKISHLAVAMNVDLHSLRLWRDGVADISILHYRMLCKISEELERIA